MKLYAATDTPVGKIAVTEENGYITGLDFREDITGAIFAPRSFLLEKAVKELNEYFSGSRRIFDLPLSPEGTTFQKAVWKALLEIPYGETRSYKDIAEAVGIPKSCRAVGIVNNKNPIPIIIPCHRVIGSDGKLVGYGGGLNIKSFLLELEGVI